MSVEQVKGTAESAVPIEENIPRRPAPWTGQVVDGFQAHWLAVFLAIWGVWVALPFLAPVLMHLGWAKPAQMIYWFYSFQCHQLPERSFFLFGPRFTYPLAQIQSAYQQTTDPAVLRHYIGNPAMGWKVAWSDRMVSMYTSVFVFAPIWWLARRRVKGLPLWGLALFLLPMAVDGGSHLVSDLSGIGQGFRDNNAWLAILTRYAFSPDFYAGDAWGSINSFLRLATGVLFGFGIVWYTLPQLYRVLTHESIIENH